MENIFESLSDEYDRWFDKNKDIFERELQAIKKSVGIFKRGLEVGVGSARFSSALGIKEGVEPSPSMREKALLRGVSVKEAYAESLPYEDEAFDLVLMITVLCFLEDAPKAFSEIERVLCKDGRFVLAFIDKNSNLGRKVSSSKNDFYKNASLFSLGEVEDMLKEQNLYTEKVVFVDFGDGETQIKEDGFTIIRAVKGTFYE